MGSEFKPGVLNKDLQFQGVEGESNVGMLGS
jgi:hypothetical protein